ncbi:MAG: hypothetical protein HY391_01560 [Deltaproteobacteria bacterium]|nr:hypothetical protein [Deltaproteobacteria bacterium]
MYRKALSFGVLAFIVVAVAGCGDDDNNGNPQPAAPFNNFPVQNRDTFGDDFLRNNPNSLFRTGNGRMMNGSDFYHAVEYQNRSRYSSYGYIPFDYIDPYFYGGYEIYDPYYSSGWNNFGGFYNNLRGDANRRYFGNGINVNFTFEFNQDSKNYQGDDVSIGL